MPALLTLSISLALMAPTPPASAAPADGGAPLDAQVWTAEGRKVQLSSFWGKPTVLIYESRGATELNRLLKDALWRRGHDPAARDAAQVLGVAALPELDWFPARPLAEHAVRERQQKVGIPVLIDWKGALTGGGWQLQAGTSSVVVLDGRGRVAFRASGALDHAQVQQVFGLLEQLTGHHS
ncbi:MAG TPA: YtfJ family protein [Myxococcales bacterium]|nr:YtfJ family protein [Myxococcales bacterium]